MTVEIIEDGETTGEASVDGGQLQVVYNGDDEWVKSAIVEADGYRPKHTSPSDDDRLIGVVEGSTTSTPEQRLERLKTNLDVLGVEYRDDTETEAAELASLPIGARHLPRGEAPPEGARVIVGPRGGKYVVPQAPRGERIPPPDDLQGRLDAAFAAEDWRDRAGKEVAGLAGIAEVRFALMEKETARGIGESLIAMAEQGHTAGLERITDTWDDVEEWFPEGERQLLRQAVGMHIPSRKTIVLTPEAFDAEEKQRLYENKYLSDPDVRHTLWHELGHYNHSRVLFDRGQSLDPVTENWTVDSAEAMDELWDEIKTSKEEPYVGEGRWALSSGWGRDAVSRYAMRSPYEFVAEVFAGVLGGQDYPDNVMAAYHDLGGPEVEPL